MISIHFMYDNHTFAGIQSGVSKDELVKWAAKRFVQDGCGTLFVRDGSDASLENLTLHGRRLENDRWGVLPEDIERWAASVEQERSFRTLMV